MIESYGKLPLSFEVNEGQTAPQARFLSRGMGYSLFLTPAEAVLTLHRRRHSGLTSRRSALLDQARIEPEERPATLRIKLAGANPNPEIAGMNELSGKVNYFQGNDPTLWRTNIATYGKVRYAQVYPGIDLVYYGNPRELEHDFIVAPGADPSAIAMRISGARKASLDSSGDLLLATGAGDVRLRKPVVYQQVNGVRREVAGEYVLKSRQRLTFHIGAYDRTRPLVIDPVLVYSTYLGGSNDDLALAIAVDSAGNAYVTGYTSSTDFPLAGSPVQSSNRAGGDVFVAKINATGTAMVYSTYLGGSSYDDASGIAVDSAGNAYVTGSTASTDFPLAGSPIQSSNRGNGDVFVARINAAGSTLAYSTYLGGGSADYANGIAVDSTGNAYITGGTSSHDFPLAGSPIQSSIRGSDDAFVARINAAGNALVYSTYLGGSGSEDAYGIALDSAGNAYVTGITSSTDLPLAGSPIQSSYRGGSFFPGYDTFIAKIDPAGSALVYSTYLGGSGDDYAYSIAVDSAGNAYVAGFTESPDFPLAGSPIQSTGPFNAFIAKINAAGNALIYSTYLGGSGIDEARGITVDSAGNAYVTGTTGSTDFPLAGSPIQSSNRGVAGGNAFVAKINPAGSALIYSTYLGGSGTPIGCPGRGCYYLGDSARGIALDSAGNAYVTGQTASPDFPLVGSPIQLGIRGSYDAFVARIATPSADLNGDGLINCDDLNIVRSSFGQRVGETGFDPRADVIQDGIVDIRDLAFVARQLPAGTECR